MLKVYVIRCSGDAAMNERLDFFRVAVQTLLLLRLSQPSKVFTLWEETETGSRLVNVQEVEHQADELRNEACRLIAAVEINRQVSFGNRADSIREQLKARQEADMAGADVVRLPITTGPLPTRTPTIEGVLQCCRYHRSGGSPLIPCSNSGQEPE